MPFEYPIDEPEEQIKEYMVKLTATAYRYVYVQCKESEIDDIIRSNIKANVYDLTDSSIDESTIDIEEYNEVF